MAFDNDVTINVCVSVYVIIAYLVSNNLLAAISVFRMGGKEKD